MAVIRDKWIHIKVSAEERQAWQNQAEAEGLTLADLIRTRMAAATVDREPRRKRAARRADPVLLAAIARVGSNVNQIAAWVNTYKRHAEAVPVIAALIAVERAVRGVLAQHHERHGHSLSIAPDASGGGTGSARAGEDGAEGEKEGQPDLFSLLPMQGQASDPGGESC